MIFIDSFSGAASDLPKGQRSAENVLEILKTRPRVSTWDMSDLPWLRSALRELVENNLIIQDKSESYPWHRYNVIGLTDQPNINETT